MADLVIEPYNIRVSGEAGERVYDVLKRAGVPFRAECGGRGLCGKCRLIIKSGNVTPPTERETRLLGEDLVKRGYRLACQTRIQGAVRLLVPPETRVGSLSAAYSGWARSAPLSPIVEKRLVEVQRPSLEKPLADADSLLASLNGERLEFDVEALRELPRALRQGSWKVTLSIWRGSRIIRVEPGDSTQENLGIAVDVGTTKVVVHLVDMNTGRTLGGVFSENPQVVYGDDIISRLRAALDNKEALEDMRRLVVGTVNNLVKTLLVDLGFTSSEVNAGVVVGNTVMHHLFLGIDVSGLSFSPFVPSFTRPLELPGASLGLENIRMVYFPPVVAGYVGSDALADVIAVGLHLEDSPSLLIDIGTNTEIVLNTGKELLACSAPSGPAFEGGHIKYGMKAMTGAIASVSIEGDVVQYSVIGGVKPIGLAGSALIDAVASLLDSGILNERGFFNRGSSSRVRKSREGEWYEYVIVYGEESGTGEDITISEKDISELRLAKAAIASGVRTLLEHAGLDAGSLEKIYVAGSFGYSIRPENAVRIGLLPEVDPSLVRQVGNTAIEGAKLMLLSEEMVAEALKVAKEIKYIELSASPYFRRHFAKSLRLG